MSVNISVVIPMYNTSRYIITALESCVCQSSLPKEVIVVDDCSSDNSLAIVREWKEKYRGPVKIIIKKLGINSGPSKARNLGWEIAQSPYVAFLDADDRFVEKKLERLVLTLREKGDIVLLAHRYALREETLRNSSLEKVSTRALLIKNLFATPAVVVKRSIPERFDENMRYTEDHDLWLRVTQKYDKTYFLDVVLTILDRPVNSLGGQSANLWEMRKGELVMYKKYCMHKGRVWQLPFLVLLSLSKHFYKWVW